MREHLLSAIYHLIRNRTKASIFATQKKQNKHQNLEEVVESGRASLELFQSIALFKQLTTFTPPKNLKTQVYDLEFPSPVTFAAYESHLHLLDLFLSIGAGGGCIKTTMVNDRPGNTRPRLQEVVYQGHKSLINALGLPGKGAQATVDNVLSSALLDYQRPLGFSIGGESIQEYEATFDIVQQAITNHTHPFYYELNISCPNTDEGQNLLNHPEEIGKLLARMRSKTDRVIAVKVSPDQTDAALCTIAEIIKPVPNIMINAGNTHFKTCKEAGLPSTAITRGGGGLSGPACFERTLAMCKTLAPFNLPIMSTGGIDSAEKVKALQEAGATLVGLATALVFNPFIINKIHRDLK